MAIKIVLLCLVWVLVVMVVGVFGQCGEEWYARSVYRQEEYPSVEDRSPSYEEPSEEYYSVKQQRSLRSSRYSPAPYRYGNDFRQDGEDDSERYSGGRKSHYDVQKGRRKYDPYGKSSRNDYQASKVAQGGVKVYERKKTSRAARYGGEGPSPSYGKTTALTYKAIPPKASCAQNLLIGCTPTVTRVPCSASTPYEAYGPTGGVPYYPPAPAYQHASAHPPTPHYGMSHPAPYGGAYGPPPSYHHPSPSHGAAQKEHPHADYHAKPSEDAHGYGPSYKAAIPAEDIPGFAAPVQEELSESPKVPIISAFPKPSDAPTGGVAPLSSTQPSPSTDGTAVETTSPKTPSSAVLTPAPVEHKEEHDEFWGVESSTDVTDGSTAR
uniref:Uncharacterized protein n=1 Tax=Anopheles christyi TaxID=43041 RepID=A0A182KCJ8_9DIPT